MVKSMTGFGRGECTQDNMTFSVDVKSVNHRYSDISVRIPRIMSALEEKVRDFVNDKLSRGKIDIYINFDSMKQNAEVMVDSNLAAAYVNSLNTLKQQFDIRDDISLSLITRFPDILKLEAVEQDSDQLWLILKEALSLAVNSLVDMRTREGERLQKDLNGKLDSIQEIAEQIREKSYGVVDEYKNKLYERIKELTRDVQIEESRLLTEVAIFADKSSIDEEIVRLESHINEFKKAMDFKGPVGKKLDFILQEMNREVNTIGSKATDLAIVNNVINIKTEIEKVREQVQNIE